MINSNNNEKIDICPQCGLVRCYDTDQIVAATCFYCESAFVEVQCPGISWRKISTLEDSRIAEAKVQAVYTGPPFDPQLFKFREDCKSGKVKCSALTRDELRDNLGICVQCGWVGTMFDNQTKCPVCQGKIFATDYKPIKYLRTSEQERPNLERSLRERYLKGHVFPLFQYRLNYLSELKKRGEDISFLSTQCPHCGAFCDKKVKIQYGFLYLKTRYSWHCDECGKEFD